MTGRAVPSGVIARVIELTHRHLAMDVTYLSRFDGDRQYFPASTGDPGSFGVDPTGPLPLGITYCARMVAGELPTLIADTAADERVRDLPSTRRAQIGSYIGVPLRLSDGTLYGSFCCSSHHARPDLSQRDVRFMEALAEMLVTELDREHERDRTRSLVEGVLSGRHIDIALQPVVSLGDGRRLGVEALARFPTEVGTPATLFPAASSVGLGLELEELAAARALQLTWLLGADEFLCVNLSPPALPAGAGMVARFPVLDPRRLVFELTEHHAVEKYDDLRTQLRQLRAQGIRVAIDDAGAGHASIYRIVQLEPDIIKMDRRLVDGCSRDRAQRSVIRGFVALAADIGALVIAEGVETADDLDTLCDLQVDAAQGYYLARPSLDHQAVRDGYGRTARLAGRRSTASR